MPDIEIPDFRFSGFYYHELLEDLLIYMRNNIPEITNESPYEPAIQLLRAYSFVGHLNNTLLDSLAQEVFLPTGRLRESVKGVLALMGEEMAEAVPATVDVLATLSTTFAATTTIIPNRALFSTEVDSAGNIINYETTAAWSTVRTDMVSAVLTYDSSAATYTDRTTEAQSAAGSTFALSADNDVGDMLYIGHSGVQFDQIDIDITVVGAAIGGVWEFYDGDYIDADPNSVVDNGDGTITFVVDVLLGTTNRSGATVRVQFDDTGMFETLTSTWNGANNVITTATTLGQSSVVTDATRYTAGVEWHPLTVEDDEINDFVPSATGSNHLQFTLPNTVTEKWDKVALGPIATATYWIRYRIIASPGAPGATIENININGRNQYLPVVATQGRSATSESFGSSTGQASQTFQAANNNYIGNTMVVYVDGDLWTEQDNFLNSTSQSKHYTLDTNDDGAAIVTFGDGTAGRIPALGAAITADYRYGANLDGNVGANRATINRSGSSFISGVTNPRAASGWIDRRGNTESDLEVMKVEGPANFRTLGRAVTPADVETLAKSWVAVDGSSPVIRARAIEEAFGAKTIECVVVATGGGVLSSAQITELEQYFNGTDATSNDGVLVANHQVTVTNHVQRTVAVTATATGGNQTIIENALSAYLTQLALKDDQVTYEHDFSGTVARSGIMNVIHESDGDVVSVALTVPAADVSLLSRELPVAGAIAIAVV